MVLELCKLCNNEERQLKSISSRWGSWNLSPGETRSNTRQVLFIGAKASIRSLSSRVENRYHDELDVLDDEFQVSNRLTLDNFFSTFVPSALINNSLPIERIDKAVTKLLNSRPRHRVKIRSRQRNTVTGSSKGGLGLKWGERPSKFILGQCRDYTPPWYRYPEISQGWAPPTGADDCEHPPPSARFKRDPLPFGQSSRIPPRWIINQIRIFHTNYFSSVSPPPPLSAVGRGRAVAFAFACCRGAQSLRYFEPFEAPPGQSIPPSPPPPPLRPSNWNGRNVCREFRLGERPFFMIYHRGTRVAVSAPLHVRNWK